ncbi:MAG TPA: CaiB/BaiF CoA-transferase family protein [Vicinamibacterales bacterium]|nr:CaiB/BaiF CoA-transferase family protein [Vicinamibacterales bacterium]
MAPLSGITVVTLEQAVAAPFATRQLADLGARVIKIERPREGDFARHYDATVKGLSSHFVWLNRSKESLTLDVKRPEAAGVLAQLLGRADVFVQNLAPGATARLGLSADVLRRRYPRLIVCNLSGYGSTGPYAERKAYDLLVQSEVGLVSITGTEQAPSKVGISIADIAAGMYAYSGILAALLSRATSGEGTSIDVSLFDALGEWMGYPAYYTAYSGTAPRRTGAEHASIAPYGPIRAADGELFVAVQSGREWTRFCADVLQWPELEHDDRFRTNSLRVANRNALHIAIESTLGSLTTADIIGRLDRAQIAYARMNSIAEYLRHPQMIERDVWRDIDSPSGTLRATKPPVRMAGVEPVMRGVPALGQQTDAILEELGVTRATIAAWRAAGVI